MRKFCITGVSGSGKSTVVDELNKKGIRAISIDDVDGLCHWEDEKTGKRVDYYPGIGKNWLDKHSYLCDVEKLKDIISKSEGVIVVAGVASNQGEFLALFDKIILLHCDESVFLKRLDTRDTNDFARDKSEQEHVLGWYKDFESQMIERGAVPINTEAPLEVVVNSVISELKVV